MATELLLASSFCLGSSLCVFQAVFVTKHSVTDTFCASSKATAPIRKEKKVIKQMSIKRQKEQTSSDIVQLGSHFYFLYNLGIRLKILL